MIQGCGSSVTELPHPCQKTSPVARLFDIYIGKKGAKDGKLEKEQVVKTVKVYDERLCKEVTEERRKLGRRNKDDDNSGSNTGSGTAEKQYLKLILTTVCS